ncbi:hypothetical protein QTL86_03535 [Cellulosilyticum sp. ST5]|uniref:hypothetical protein n=1 Tax=Cellulosilyticum sp. ST5 TaxID=3055805 RepID=UPI0039774CE6
MAYIKRTWTNSPDEAVTYEDFNRIEEGIENLDTNKLDLEKVVNENTALVADKKALNAAQANPNVEGSLANKINDLLTKTQIPLPYNSGFIDYATSALESYVVKNGLNECKLVINAKPSTGQFSAGQTAIATLPSGYIPSKGYSVGARNSAMTGCSVEILPNGTVNVYTASASDYVFAVIPYDLEV